jgi:hypothetical protein
MMEHGELREKKEKTKEEKKEEEKKRKKNKKEEGMKKIKRKDNDNFYKMVIFALKSLKLFLIPSESFLSEGN